MRQVNEILWGVLIVLLALVVYDLLVKRFFVKTK